MSAFLQGFRVFTLEMSKCHPIVSKHIVMVRKPSFWGKEDTVITSPWFGLDSVFFVSFLLCDNPTKMGRCIERLPFWRFLVRTFQICAWIVGRHWREREVCTIGESHNRTKGDFSNMYPINWKVIQIDSAILVRTMSHSFFSIELIAKVIDSSSTK